MTNVDDDDAIFGDDPGQQVYSAEDIAVDRGVTTTPYDAPVRTLLDEIREKSLIVNPPFQRLSVWRRDRQSKLVESLLLNIPIPVLYFAEDDDGTRVVVDGQQRLRALEEFHAGTYALSGLEVLSTLNGQRWADLSPKQSRTILSRTLRCVVISASSPATLRFEMFERLNTGGIPLNDQELRNCVYRGTFNDLINELVNSKPWLITIRRPEPDVRLRHHELALRFFALDDGIETYRPPLKKVLSDHLKNNRNPTKAVLNAYAKTFNHALANVHAVFGEHAFRLPRNTERWEFVLNRAVFDVQMLGFRDANPDEVRTKKDALLAKFQGLCLNDAEFFRTLTAATADRRNLSTRLRIWGEALVEHGITPNYLKRLPTT